MITCVLIDYRPQIIYFCALFWNQPRNGQNSKAGTLIHEAAHWAITGDAEYGFDQLAINSPNKAVVNADNYQFYAEGAA